MTTPTPSVEALRRLCEQASEVVESGWTGGLPDGMPKDVFVVKRYKVDRLRADLAAARDALPKLLDDNEALGRAAAVLRELRDADVFDLFADPFRGRVTRALAALPQPDAPTATEEEQR